MTAPLLMMRRRMMLQAQSGSGGLPDAYQQVEWIASDGSAYINTGIECTGDLAVKFKFLYTTSENRAVCGGIKQTSTGIYFRHHCSPQNSKIEYWIQHSSLNNAVVRTYCLPNTVITAEIDPANGTANVNGTTSTFTRLSASNTTGNSYGIMARISDAGAIQSKPSRFYYFQFYRNNQMIGDFIPCYRKSDSVIGMYDTVTKTFFTNSGTGTFTIPT